MSKEGKLRKKFDAFVGRMSRERCREQLVLAYLQMERCCDVLRGEDVEPLAMDDNGESSDLELFYRCKKVRKELDLKDGETLANDNSLQILQVSVCGENDAKNDFTPDRDTIEAIKAYSRKYFKKRKFRDGDEVWYMFGDRVQHGNIEHFIIEEDGVAIYKTDLGHETAECETFRTLDELIDYLKRTAHE